MPQQFEFPGRQTSPQLRFSPKMLYLVLGVLVGLWRDRLEEAGIDSQRRAETLTLEDWARLWRLFNS